MRNTFLCLPDIISPALLRVDICQTVNSVRNAAKDVRDASKGVLGDLKRFQEEKEDDLKRYMVSQITLDGLQCEYEHTLTCGDSLHTPELKLSGRRRIRRRGRRLRPRSTRSMSRDRVALQSGMSECIGITLIASDDKYR